MIINLKNTYKIKIITFLALLFFCSGCVPSLQPFFNQEDLIANPLLMGSWLDEKNEAVCIFQQTKDKEYELIVKHSDSVKYFFAYLFELDGGNYLDIYPKNKSKHKKYYLGDNAYLPTHTICKIKIEKNKLIINTLNQGVLEYLIKNNLISIAHEYVGGHIILIATTTDLQKFLVHYRDEKGLFYCSYKFIREK